MLRGEELLCLMSASVSEVAMPHILRPDGEPYTISSRAAAPVYSHVQLSQCGDIGSSRDYNIDLVPKVQLPDGVTMPSVTLAGSSSKRCECLTSA